jgi:uncharacterized membrane protein YcjF (UPF0283 family)
MQQIFTLATRAALIVGALLTLIAVSEVLDLYLSLQQLSPLVATLFASVVVLLVGGGAVYVLVQWYAHPPVLLAPPRTQDLARDVPHYARYLARYLERLAENELLGDEARRAGRVAARRLSDAIDLPAGEIEGLLREVERTTAEPLLAVLRASAEAEVRRCVRDVMAGVTLSPYRSSDLLVVLYRNGSMVLRLAALYGGRPRLAEQLAIGRDTLRVVAAVNFLNLGNKLLEGILAGVPMVGRFADDVAQGLGAGFLTSAVGHAAMQRCEAFHGWDRAAAVETLGVSSKRFLADVRDIFFKDIYPSMRARLPQSDLRDRLGIGIRAALDATLVGVDGFVTRPVLAGGRAVARTGSSLRERFGRGRVRAGTALQRLTNRARARFGKGDPPVA